MNITFPDRSGTQTGYASDWNLATDHACVLRTAFRAKLNVLERNSETLTKNRYASRHCLKKTLRYANRVRIRL